MANGPQYVAELARVCEMHPATFDRYLRELRALELIDPSRPGGRRGAVHFDADDTAWNILALAATTPGQSKKPSSSSLACAQPVWDDLA